MILTKQEDNMAEGKYGPGIERCLRLLIKYGDALGAERFVNVASAHVFMGFPIDLLTELSNGVEEAQASTTLHPFMSLSDPSTCQQMGIDPEHCGILKREHGEKMEIYKRLGFYCTYTCVPHLVGNLPKKGDYVSWFGSGIQLVVNSVIGAKQNRDGAVVNMAIAITGKAPLRGLYLDENRSAEVQAQIEGLDIHQLTTTEYGAIGYYIGAIAQDRNTVVNGLRRDMSLDEIKYLLTPMSTSGGVSICHIVGVTPEAPDLKSSLKNKRPKEVIHVGGEEIRKTIEKYSGPQSGGIDLVIIGCPHCSIGELKEMANLLQDQKVGTNQQLWIGTAHQIYDLARTMGYAQIIERAGGIASQSCMATIPDCPLPDEVKTIATNSFKTAHYVSAISKGRVKAVVGDLDQCIKAAIIGRWEGGL
jgi:predicted aconitase